MADLTGFRLDPPRGKPTRCAVALFTKADEEGFHIHKLEYIEPDQIKEATACFVKLRTLSKHVRPNCDLKRTHEHSFDTFGGSPADTKRCRTLQKVPTDASWRGDP